MKNMLSVVLPAYNEGLMIGKTCRVLREVLEGAGIPYERFQRQYLGRDP